MKKALLISVVLLVFTLPVMAGPYFSLENTGLTIAPEFTLGADGSFVTQTGTVLKADIYWVDADLFDYDSIWSLGFSAYIVFSAFKMDVETGFSFDPATAEASDWIASFKVTGKPINFLTLWAGVDIPVGSSSPWELEPSLGIECHW